MTNDDNWTKGFLWARNAATLAELVELRKRFTHLWNESGRDIAIQDFFEVLFPEQWKEYRSMLDERLQLASDATARERECDSLLEIISRDLAEFFKMESLSESVEVQIEEFLSGAFGFWESTMTFHESADHQAVQVEPHGAVPEIRDHVAASLETWPVSSLN